MKHASPVFLKPAAKVSPLLLLRRPLLALLVLVLFVAPGRSYGLEHNGSYEENRARLLGFVLRQNLESYHFTHRKIDDELSKAAFTLYLKQLDGQKRLLLQEDVDKLSSYSEHIGEEIGSGRLDLPDKAAAILAKRAWQAEKIVRELLSQEFVFSIDESIETDSDKFTYCASMDEFKERWRKIVKYQVLNQYLSLLDDEVQKPGAPGGAEKKKEPTKDLLQEAREKVQKNYETFFSRLINESERDRYDRLFVAVSRAFDPHTEYMPPMSKEDFDISMRGSLEGIGATLQEEDGYIKIVAVVPGGPAFRQGQLRAGDFILKVGEGDKEQVDLANMRVSDAVKLIRGKKGTLVKLTVRKPDRTQVLVKIVRDVVQIEESFVKGTPLKDEKTGKNYGYIKIPSFYRDFEKTKNGGEGRNSTDDVVKELEKLGPDTAGLIIDLRNNGGGALEDAVKIAGLFIKNGPVVQIRNSEGRISVLSDDNPETSYSRPVVILVNKFSASASEILAGALQDYGRAVIMGGEHTHGKGTVQSIVDLNDIPFKDMDRYKTLGALRLTIQKFYRITGESTQYRGVTPDIVLPDVLKGIKSEEKYLDNALPWDTVKPASYAKWPTFTSGIACLEKRSEKRLATNKDFIEIRKESEWAMEQQKKTLQSLNLDAARRERDEAKSHTEKHGKSLLDDVVDHGKKQDTEQSEEQKKERWIKDVSSDAYVREAESVLDDLNSPVPLCPVPVQTARKNER